MTKKKLFYNYIISKRRAKENLHPLLDVVGNTTIKDEEKAEVLKGFLAFVFDSQICYPQSTQLFELEDRDGEKNNPPIIQEETVACYAT